MRAFMSDLRKLKPGDRLWWNDPDGDTCSRWLTIKNITLREPFHVTIEDISGDIVEGYAGEFSLT